MWLNSVLLDSQLQFRRPRRRETSAAWVGFHQPQKEPAGLQPLPNKFSKPAAGTEPFFCSYTEVLECEVPPGKQRRRWCKLINRETVWTDVTSSPESRFDGEKEKNAWALKRARREAQFRLCCFIQDFTWACLTGDIPFTVWTPGYWWTQYIKYLVHFWVLSDVVSYSTGIRQYGFQMAEEGLELRSASPQTRRIFHLPWPGTLEPGIQEWPISNYKPSYSFDTYFEI